MSDGVNVGVDAHGAGVFLYLYSSEPPVFPGPRVVPRRIVDE